jgi:hypothetical protein
MLAILSNYYISECSYLKVNNKFITLGYPYLIKTKKFKKWTTPQNVSDNF